MQGKFVPVSCAPFYITNIDETASCHLDAKERHLTMYYEFFHGWLDKKSVNQTKCNLCSKAITIVPKHIFINCTKIKHIRNCHFQRGYDILVEILQKLNTSHQMIFAQLSLKSFTNPNVHENNSRILNDAAATRQQVHTDRVGSLQIKHNNLMTFLNAQMFESVCIQTCTYHCQNLCIMLNVWSVLSCQ